VRFLSDEWLAGLDRAAGTIEVDPDVSIVIEQTVRADAGDVVWHTTVEDGAIEFGSGPAPEAIVRMSADTDTAWHVASGRLSAQRAFLDGRLTLAGDVRSLITARPALEAIAAAFSGIRTETDSPY
jgi:putative sterol carrier protein